MSRFTTQFVACQLEDGIHWKMWMPLVFIDEILGIRTTPVGFETDGGSIPSFFQGLINPYGRGFRAFVNHDHDYATQDITREQADECLRRALRACGENWLDADTQFNAVRFGGEQAWLEDQKKYNLKPGVKT